MDLGVLWSFANLPLGSMLVVAGFGPSHIHQSPNCGWLCNCKEVVQGQSQAESDIGLHHSPSQMAPQQTHTVDSFRQHQNKIQLDS